MIASLYQLGGSLEADHPTYVKRQADEELYLALKNSKFCYVFNCRQMGKSSLSLQTKKRLEAEGFTCTIVDFIHFSSKTTQEQFYGGIINHLSNNFGLKSHFNLNQWWKKQELLSPTNKFALFIQDILLRTINKKIVIFLDEIDSILGLDVDLDGFFALIRSFYNERANNPEFKRITFCLLGVASPSDLMQDRKKTPFNIGQGITLEGFKLEEVSPLIQGLVGKFTHPQQVMEEILEWTGGQPFLTQKLCELMVDEWKKNSEKIIIYVDVEQVVREKIIQHWVGQDNPSHLRVIKDRLLAQENLTVGLLGIYQKLWQQETVVVDNSPEQTELRLSGLVISFEEKLRIYNLIYREVFNQQWIAEQLEKLRPYSQSLNAWVDSNYQDKSRLLRGKVLQDALSWAKNKNLTLLDHRFFNASQDLEKREVEYSLAVKEEESRILAAANDTLNLAQKKAKRRIKISSVLLLISLVGVIFTSLFASSKIRQVKLEKAEADVLLARSVAENALVKNPLDGLIEAIKAGKEIKNLEESASVNNEILNPVKNTLRDALSSVREFNRFDSSPDRIRSLSFSPDGKLLASGDDNNTVKLWSMEGKLIKVFEGHTDNIWSVRFSPNGNILASASDDGTVKLWNVKDGSLIKTISAHPNTWVRSISFSSDSKLLASSGSKGWVKLWNVKDGTLVEAIRAHKSDVTYVQFSPDGKLLASASFDTTVKLWNVENHSQLDEKVKFEGHKNEVRSVSFSPDGKTLASSSADGTVKLWNIEDGKENNTLVGHRSTVWSVSFSDNGKLLVSSGNDGTLQVWNVKDPNNQPQTFNGHFGRVNSVTFNPKDNNMLASAGNDGKIRLWYVISNHSKYAIDQSPRHRVTVSPRQSSVANLEGNDINSKEPKTLAADNGRVRSVSFSPDGKCLAAGYEKEIIKICDVEHGSLITTLPPQGNEVWRVRFSRDGKLLATASRDGIVKLWNVENWTEEKYTLKAHNKWVRDIAFSPDSKLLASASNDGTVKLWRVEDGELWQNFQGHAGSVWGVKFSPDGQTLATVSLDRTLKLWNVKNGKLLKTFDGETIYLTSVSFSPDGKLLAAGSGESTVKLWNIADGKNIRTIKGHGVWVRDVSFSPDGKTLATASYDRTVKLWNVDKLLNIENDTNETLEQTLKGHVDGVETVSFSPDGKLIASGSKDGNIKLWNLALDVDGLMKLGCNHLENYLETHQDKELQTICDELR